MLLLVLITAAAFSVEMTLEKAIATAVENNLDIRMADIDIAISRYDIFKSLSSFLPTFDIDYTKINTDPPSMTMPPELNNLDLTLSVPIFTGMARFFGTTASLKTGKLYRQKKNADLLNIEFQTKVSFFTLLFLKERIEIEKQAVKVAEDEHRIMEAQYKKGEIPKPVLTAQKVNLEAKKYALRESENSYTDAKEKFKSFLKMEESIDPVGQLSEAVRDHDRGALLSAVEDSSNIQMMKTQLKLLKDLKWISLAPMMPIVAYSTVWSHTAMDFSWEASDWTRSNAQYLIVSIPVFSGYSALFDFKKSSLEVKKAKLNLEKTKDALKTQLNSALLDADNIKATLALLKENYAMAEDNYSMTKEMYEKGEMSYTDLEKAQLLLNDTRLAFIGTLLKKEIADATIEYLTN